MYFTKQVVNTLPSGPPALFDYLRSDVRNLSRYMAELEEQIEGNRTFATSRWATTRRAWPS